jgi:glycerol-3-phosphate dehydrogenase
MMERDYQKLKQGPFDVLVIGGGIYGAWVAYDAALRGMKVALVEKHDWAAGTSSASSKLIHGGLRYLEYSRFGLVRKGLDERKRLWELGPHRVRPLRFVMPLYAGSRVGRMRLKLGLWLYDRLARGEQPVPPHEQLTGEDLAQSYDFLETHGLRGGFTFGDCMTDDARLTLEIVDGAQENGAVALNRASAIELLQDGDNVVGARIVDLESAEPTDVQAGVTINCAGPWAAQLLEQTRPRIPAPGRLSKGVHLVMPGLPTADGFLLLSKERGRVVFLIPWYGATLLGTTDTDYHRVPDEVRVEEEDVTFLLHEANRVLETGWTDSDILSSYAGLRLLPAQGGSASADVTREISITEPLPRLLVPVGGKLTSARVDAAQIVRRAISRIGHGETRCLTGHLPLPWRPAEPFDEWQQRVFVRGLDLGLDEAVLEACQMRYGSRLERIYELIEKLPKLANRITPEAPFCRAELVYAAKFEMARSLQDVLRRRIPLLLLTRLDEMTVRMAAQVTGKILNWSEQRKQEEVDSILGGPSAPTRAHGTG